MKKAVSAILLILISLVMSAPAFADAALPRRFYLNGEARQWVIAFVVAIVILAVVIIIGAIRYHKKGS